MFRRFVTVAFAGVLLQCNSGPTTVTADPELREAEWHFVRQTTPAPEASLTSVYGTSTGTLYVVGWGGVILTNKSGSWQKMASPTVANLTAITGVENGAAFDLTADRGEMFAVGWHGTVLYYHPNPDGDPETDDGAWQVIASAADPVTGELAADGVATTFFSPLLRPDNACPDFDGDGRADDGDNDGWIGNVAETQHVCIGGNATSCDDNCRVTANGNQRPLGDADVDGDGVPDGTGCVGPGSQPILTRDQKDQDADGIGQDCDDDDLSPSSAPRFTSTLFSVWARAQGNNVTVFAVGESGAFVSFSGVNSVTTPTGTLTRVNDRAGWFAQTTLPYRFVDDCDDSTPAGTSCPNGRLPPSCPAQCSPKRTTCSCPTGGGQCCDDDPTLTGASGPDGPAANGCNAVTAGQCSTLCPTCFRRLDETLRGISVQGDDIAAVGAAGTIVYGRVDALDQPFSAPSCATPPAPLDQKPVLAAVQGSGNRFQVVGAAGAVFRLAASGACAIESRTGAPQGFLSGVFATGVSSGYAVGDGGLFLLVDGTTLTSITTGITQNLFSIWETASPLTDDEVRQTGRDPADLDPTVPRDSIARFWLTGADGTIVQAAFF